jgi:hypothetical protein
MERTTGSADNEGELATGVAASGGSALAATAAMAGEAAMRPRLRAYADTSVFGGAFDEEFQPAGSRFFDLVRDGTLELVICIAVRDELAASPPGVRGLYAEMLAFADIVDVPSAALHLRSAYIAAGVVSARHALDALHVATATVSKCAMIVSWNFKHIVNYRRIPMYNAVNALNGYNAIAIYSPLELVNDEREEGV